MAAMNDYFLTHQNVINWGLHNQIGWPTGLHTKSKLAVTQANLNEAVSSLEIAERELNRVHTLTSQGIGSESALDVARADQLARQAAVKVAEAQVMRAAYVPALAFMPREQRSAFRLAQLFCVETQALQRPQAGAGPVGLLEDHNEHGLARRMLESLPWA